MVDFGWSLPPGCGTLPGEEDVFCEVCLGNPDIGDGKDGACICPECPVCGECGDPNCYEDGHLKKSEAQIRQAMLIEKDLEEDASYLDEGLSDIEHMSMEDTIL